MGSIYNLIKGSLDAKVPSYEVLKMRENRCLENRCVETRLEKSRVHFSWQEQYLVKLECHFSWHGQHFVNFDR